jgi:multidrug efflux pump subunit AcrB
MSQNNLPHQTDTSHFGFAGQLAAKFQNNALTPLLAIVALLMGLFAVLVTPREEEPQINVTMANVLIPFPGASSEDVQNKVARPAEQVLGQIAGIEHTYSVSRPGMAVLTVQFQVGVPRTDALVRLYDVLNANQNWLPRDLGTLPPIVKPKGIDDVPVLAVTLWGKDAPSALELERVARSLEMDLKQVKGTREVQTIGGPGRAVQVNLNPTRLRERGLDLLGVQAALAGANTIAPSGQVMNYNNTSGQRINIETGNFFVTNYTRSYLNSITGNWTILQDPDGVIYIGNSFNGILVYDGQKIRRVLNNQGLPKLGGTRTLVSDSKNTIYAILGGEFGYLEKNKFGESIFYSLSDKLPKKDQVNSTLWSAGIINDTVIFQSEKSVYLYKYKKPISLQHFNTARIIFL